MRSRGANNTLCVSRCSCPQAAPWVRLLVPGHVTGVNRVQRLSGARVSGNSACVCVRAGQGVSKSGGCKHTRHRHGRPNVARVGSPSVLALLREHGCHAPCVAGGCPPRARCGRHAPSCSQGGPACALRPQTSPSPAVLCAQLAAPAAELAQARRPAAARATFGGVQGQWARGVTPCCHRSMRRVAIPSELCARAEADARAGRGLQIWPGLLTRHRKPLSGSRCGGGVAVSLSLAHRWQNGRHRHRHGYRMARLPCACPSLQLRATGATLEHSSCLAARERYVSRYICSVDLGHSRAQERGPCFPTTDMASRHPKEEAPCKRWRRHHWRSCPTWCG